jgi:hypothetical protein
MTETDVIRTPDQRGTGVCEVHAAGAGRGAPGGAGCGDQFAAGGGDVRAGRPAAPAAAGVPGLYRAEPDPRGHLLAELRWVAPGEHVSGLEDEYRLSAVLPRLIYVKSPAADREPR